MGEDVVSDKVWIRDPETVWRSAEVIGFDEETNELEVATEVFGRYDTKSVNKEATLSYDKDHDEDFEDAFKMGDLNEAALLNLLRKRSLEDHIYTFTGDVLLSVNPYKPIPKLYEPMPKSEELKSEDPNASPHLYVLAERAYTALFARGIRGTSQAVLINGESGAGKTEAAKRMMAFLMELSQRKRATVKKKKGKKKGGRYGGYGAAGGVNLNRRRKKKEKGNNLARGSIQRFAGKVLGTKKRQEGIEAIDRKQSEIEKIILRTNPLMEAFGNARTIRNDNSSRFGKFVQLEYDQNEIIKGARTRHFLLEKSRVTAHGRGERNYHIFYQMCAAFEADPTNPVFDDLQMLRSYEHYKYLQPTNPKKSNAVVQKRGRKRSNQMKRDGVKKMAERAVKYMKAHKAEITKFDVQIYQAETSVALDNINLEVEDQKNIWKVLAAILHLGNLEFETVKEADKWGKLMDVTAVKPDSLDVHGEPRSTLELCAELLGVEADLLSGALTRKTFSAGSKRASVTEVPLSVAEASKSRDGLAKAMYEALFEWMLDKINAATSSAVEDLLASQGGGPSFGAKKKNKYPAPKAKDVFIGILDIFGFEMLEDNSFEQLCINYANETLQGMFDAHVFEIEKEAYAEENIDFDQLNLKFRENQPLLELLNKRGTGIFQLMDEQGALGSRGGDDKLFRAIQNIHDHPRGPRGKTSDEEERFAGAEESDDGRFFFSINHFAGIVKYTISGMVAKNADHLQADLADLIAIGGMPEKDPNLTAEELKKMELEQRMGGKKGKKQEKEVDDTPLEDKNQTNSFAFLRNILRMRNKRSKGTDDDEANNDEDAPKKKKAGRRKRKKMAKLQSVSARFRKQMTSLQKLLDTTEQHFVRCIKPNDLKLPPQEKWDYHMVNAQLRMLGALEMVRVRREGYPIRTLFEDFLPRYPELTTKWEIEWSKGIDDRQACVAFLTKIDEDGKNKRWYLGDTKIFLRESTFKSINDQERALRELKQEREEKLRRLKERKEREEKMNKGAVKFQTQWRAFIQRKKYLQFKKAVTRVQAGIRRKQNSKPIAFYVQRVITVQKIARGFLVRVRYKKLGNIAAQLTPIAQGYIVRRKTDAVFAKRKEYKDALVAGECIVLETECITDKLKKRDTTTSPKPHSLILTTGPSPRILYVNKLSGLVVLELTWDERVLCGLMANESKLILYSMPSFRETEAQAQKNSQNVHRFTFKKPVAAIWLLALKQIHTVHDVLRLEAPDYEKVVEDNPNLTKQDIIDHGNMLPLNVRKYRHFLFGGEFVLGGLKKVRKQQIARLNQKHHWRSRFFVLKESTLFWFQTDQAVGQDIVKAGVYPVGGINLSTETTINMASTNPNFFNKQYKQKLSLEIESRVLRASLKINFASQKFRQNWVTVMKTEVRKQVRFNQQKRLSIREGVLDKKGFMNITPEELLAPTASEHTNESEAAALLIEEDEQAEDIEQGLVEEIF